MLNRLANIVSGKYITYGLMAVTAVSIGMWQWERTGVAKLETQLAVKSAEITELNRELSTQKIAMEYQKSAQKILGTRIEEERKTTSELIARLKDISDAQETSNGPVSDVLRRSLERLPDYESPN